MASDNSATTFILFIFAGFLLIRWYSSSRKPSSISDGATPDSSRTDSQTASEPYGIRRRRAVTKGMIEVVQTLLPNIPDDVIRRDLERTGNVEITIQSLLENPQFAAAPPVPPASSSTSTGSTSQNLNSNLIDRYNLHNKVSVEAPISVSKTTWTDDPASRQESLKKRREDMILHARQKVLSSKDK
ncbi:hypothetical protein CANCADRAFT_4017 [Tortispora caseinolytica NRRL Y-17796]|uniref:CUE domain-containing protein n=1 Tax=Tortispora caseinolytica NRRL Y-17796 TaxID=767744 RepID=A0A1E4TCA9_9ASCO|nr:hypothetical protein CANCADRAFT_4017 [Tortispora caseinolytica NRRL Y-17796]